MKLFNLNTVLFCSLCLIFSSCLDLEPKDNLADSNIWKTPDHYSLFANQFYGWLRGFNNVTSDGPHSDYRSDLISGDTRNIYSNGTNPIPTEDKNFTDAYTRIRQVNILLQKAESYSSPKDIETPVGEAKFFRAYVYFELLQLYGDALIVREPVEISSPELKMQRNSRGEVIDFIIQDLREAIPCLPAYKSLTAGGGRVSQEAAQAFLSRVTLYEGTWQKFRVKNAQRAKDLLDIAKTAAYEVIKGGQFSLFKPTTLGTDAYKYLFVLENEKCNPSTETKQSNKEYILRKEYDSELHSLGSNPAGSFFGKTSFVTRKFANLFLKQDGLPIDPTDEDLYKTVTSEYGNRDNRMQSILLIAGRPYWTSAKGRSSWKEDATDLALAFYSSFEPYMNSGYFSQKWNAERQINGYPGFDFPVIRYAEVLLNYAEAVYELYESNGNITDTEITKALDVSLNLVRQRVNPTMPKLSVDFVTQYGLDMREEIRRERTIELFHEGFRIDDLKRWDTAGNEMKKDLLGVKYVGTEFETKWGKMTRPTNAEGCIIMETGRKWEEKHYLYPLPVEQLQLNPNLKQNPGWGE